MQMLLGCVLRFVFLQNMLSKENEESEIFRATVLGHLMARWYLSFDTVRQFNHISNHSTFEDFLDIFSRAAEWNAADFRIKAGDKVRQHRRTRCARKGDSEVGALTNISVVIVCFTGRAEPVPRAPPQEEGAAGCCRNSSSSIDGVWGWW
jgi:hypothetical protein